MDSKLANEKRNALIAAAERLSWEEPLRAFVRHSTGESPRRQLMRLGGAATRHNVLVVFGNR